MESNNADFSLTAIIILFGAFGLIVGVAAMTNAYLHDKLEKQGICSRMEGNKLKIIDCEKHTN